MSAQSPRPTDHDPSPGNTLNRRDFAKAVGMAAAVGAGGAASSGTVRAQDGLVDGVRSSVSGAATAAKYGIAATGPVGATAMVGLVAYGALKDSVNGSPSADKAILHQLCTSEYKSLTQHEVTFNNRIIDAKPVAHLEARHGIATGYEQGDSASEGYDRALSRTRQYWELPEFNHTHVTNKTISQIMFAEQTARSADFDFTIAAASENSNGDFRQVRFTGETQTVDFTLYDGTSIANVDEGENEDVLGDYEDASLEAPVLEFYDEANSTVIGTAPWLTNTVADSWDSSAENVTYEVDGETITTQLRFNVPNVSAADLESERIFDGTIFFDLLDRIHQNSDDTVGTYDVSFVEDLYGELDAGNISTEDVRGPEGMTHFLSGTDDPQHARFRIAMLSLFDMQQPDFTRIAQMSVTWSGATGSSVDTDPNLNERRVHPDEFVEGESYTGVLFSDRKPDDGFNTGETYAVAPTMYFNDGSTVRAVDPYDSFSTQWEYSSSGAIRDIGVGPQGDHIYVGTEANTVEAVDVTTGETVWSYSTAGQARSVGVANGRVISYTNANLVGIDAADGSELWTTSVGDYGFGAVLSPDGETAFQCGPDNTLRVYDTSDGSQKWTYSASNSVVDAVVDSDTAYVGIGTDNQILALPRADEGETTDWTYSTAVAPNNMAKSPDGGLIHAAGDNTLEGVTTDGSQEYTFADFSERPDSVAADPDGEHVYLGLYNAYEVWKVEVATGTVKSKETALSESIEALSFREFGDVSGIAGQSMMFDEPSNSEITLSNGLIEIDEMTDTDGATVTHVDDGTISDIEGLSATPDSVDSIVSDMDQFDSADDIRYVRHVEAILEHYESTASVGGEDDDSDVTVQDTDYSRPDYDATNSAEFAAEINELEKKVEQLQTEDDEGGGGGGGPLFPDGFGLEGSGGLLGLGIIGIVILAVIGIVTDAIPGLGN